MKKMQNVDKCTILINSCDAYEDLWGPFFKLFKKEWVNCPYRIVLNTESKKYIDDSLKIDTINYRATLGKSLYGRRIKKCLKMIKTPYVLLLLDDFFLREPVNTELINTVLTYLDSDPDIECFNFDVHHDKYDIDDNRFPGFCKRSKYGEYKFNMQAGIWRTKDLYKAWKNLESPWQWELYGNYRSWNNRKKIYTLKQGMKTPLEYGYYPAVWGVYRGKWVIEDVKDLFEENGISIDYSKRGEYIDEVKPKDIKHQVLKKLYSYGFFGYIKYFFWYVKNRIKTKKRSLSYSESMNAKEYGEK